MTAPELTCECHLELRARFTAMGTEVYICPWRPDLMPTGYESLDLRCPHGDRSEASPW